MRLLTLLPSLPRRRAAGLAAAAVASLGGAAALPAAADADHSQTAIMEDASIYTNPAGTLQVFRSLGASTTRVVMYWYYLAPRAGSAKKPKFDATDPNAYSAKAWAPYDAIVRDAAADGIKVDFTVAGGAPLWAQGGGIPAGSAGNGHYAWRPDAADYGQFMQAVGKRYDGHFTPRGHRSPLPKVSFWALWNEPNFGEDLAPQAEYGSSVSIAPTYYRSMANQGYAALRRTGHGRDTILIGGLAAQGSGPTPPHRGAPQGNPGDYGQTPPVQFIKTLYCLNGGFGHLSGGYARATGCPTTAAGMRSFRARNPALFDTSGVGVHPYGTGNSPAVDGRGNGEFALFQDLGNVAHVLDVATHAWGSGKRFQVYNDEYGYITNPPNRQVLKPQYGGRYPSPATAAVYLNQAEYLSWRNPRVASYMQYELVDPRPTQSPYNGFASGLYTYGGRPKATLYAYRLPLWLPRTRLARSTAALVWGEARPAGFMRLDSGRRQTVAIQFQAHGRGRWKTVQTVKASGYFEVRQRFPTSGDVRLAYRFPASDPFLPVGLLGHQVTGRSQPITVG